MKEVLGIVGFTNEYAKYAYDTPKHQIHDADLDFSMWVLGSMAYRKMDLVKLNVQHRSMKVMHRRPDVLAEIMEHRWNRLWFDLDNKETFQFHNRALTERLYGRNGYGLIRTKGERTFYEHEDKSWGLLHNNLHRVYEGGVREQINGRSVPQEEPEK